MGKKHKFIYIPKNPPPKTNLSTKEGGGSKTVEEASSVRKINKGIILDSPSIINKLIPENPPKRTSCTIEENFDDLDDGYTENT